MISLVALVSSVALVSAPCPYQADEVSCYEPAQHTIYLAPGWTEDIYFHEFGHAFDFTVLTDSQRDKFKRLLGYPPQLPWRQEPRYRLAPDEAFANAYSDCARGTWVRIRKLCAMLPRSAYAVWFSRLATPRD